MDDLYSLRIYLLAYYLMKAAQLMKHLFESDDLKHHAGTVRLRGRYGTLLLRTECALFLIKLHHVIVFPSPVCYYPNLIRVIHDDLVIAALQVCFQYFV